MKSFHSKILLQKVISVLKEADGEDYAVVLRNADEQTYEIWIEGKCTIVNIADIGEAVDTAKGLNYQYMAHKAIKTTLDYVKDYIMEVI